MAGYRQAIKLLDDEIRALRDRLARFSDQPGVSREAKELGDQLQRKEEERLVIQQWLDNVDPEALQWGPDQQLDEMMGRYPSEQMGLDLQGGAVPDNPFMQIDESLYTTDPSTWRRGLESDRAVPGPDLRQRDMFEPGITINKSRKGFPIEDDVWGHSRLTRDEMEGRYMILRKQSDELEASYQAGDIPRLKNSPHGESYEDSRARLNSALEDIEHRMQYNWD